MSMLRSEAALIMGALNALIALAVGFGLTLTPQQVSLINAAVAAIIAVIIRQNVVAQDTNAAQVAEAQRK
jgi:hypothetical protein